MTERLSLDKLIGKKSKHDVLNSVGLLLVPARVAIDESYIRLLEQHHIHESEILILDEGQADSAIAPSALVRKAAAYSKEMFEQTKFEKRLPLQEITDELIPIVQQVASHPDVFQLFESVKAKDEYTHQHNIGVGVLSTLIGKWMGLSESELSLLSMAATLHDVGKIHISEDILMKPGKLTEEEYEEVKRHTTYGHTILKGTEGLDPRVSLIALQHHERLDGKGYPQGLKGNEIDLFSRIVAVADVFHAMSSKRPYHEALPFHEIVKEMREGAFGELDPKVVSVFLTMMIRHLIGTKVRLSDGRWGEVVYINPHDDVNPLIKVEDEFLDLSQVRHIFIEEIVV